MAIRDSDVILPVIHGGIRKSGMYVNDWSENQSEREMKRSPRDHAVRDIGRANTIEVGANDRLLERNQDVTDHVQISSRSAPDVGNVQNAFFDRVES